jgi:hypothetical protein
MAPIAVAFLAFALALIGILLGSVTYGMLPERHLSPDSKEAVSVGAFLRLLARLVPLCAQFLGHFLIMELSPSGPLGLQLIGNKHDAELADHAVEQSVLER